MFNKSVVIILAVLLILVCVTGLIVAGIWQLTATINEESANTAIDQPATITSTPTSNLTQAPVAATPNPTHTTTTETDTTTDEDQLLPSPESVDPTATPAPQLSTEETLQQAILPERDQRQLAIRLVNNGQDIPATSPQPAWALGDTDTFWITDNTQTPPRQFQVEATVQYITDHSYWWVQSDMTTKGEALERSAELFESATYPTTRAFFGSEWSPGVDEDVRVHIFMGNVPGVAGYYSASNEYTAEVDTYSNEREMFFINLNAISPGTQGFDSVLAHEFQHMIHWHQDRNEDTWLNEGASELSAFINGYGSSNFLGAHTSVPDTQLTGWGDSPGGSAANYGGSFRFLAYFLQRYGDEMMKAVVAHPQNGTLSFDEVLAEQGYEERFNDIFTDFLIANTLQDTTAGEGLWGYENLPPNPIAITEQHNSYPTEAQTIVNQYGGDYIELTGMGDLTIEFTGATQVKVINNEPYSGNHQWYSHRGDDTNTRLTHAFDLTEVNKATLNYWIWYDIETDWDYGYVEVSTNGGTSWDILATPYTDDSNPTGNAYGPGYTGSSDGWLEESLDLTPYAGQEILVRFEYVTDDAVNRPGWAVDDMSIPEIGFFDDAESGPGNWQAEGFVHIDNTLPQYFSVQLIEIGQETTVRPFLLNETNQGSLTIEGLGTTVDRAILVVSGLTPVTSQPASYQYKITQ
ncbi:MAG: hypothetical protein AAF485_01140 [Chloroflexota bacterium]